MKFCKTPNQHTKKPSFSADGRTATIKGYHSFKLTKVGVTPIANSLKIKKFEELKNKLPDLTGKSVLDLGSANGLYTFMAYFRDASHITAVDIDQTHLDMITNARVYFQFTNITTLKKNVKELDQEADVVFAMALIHWLYSCTSDFGSLDAIIGKLAELTRETLIVEWISQKDANIQGFGHLDYNPEVAKSAYNKTNFINALKKYFTSYELAYKYTGTREIYIAIK